jgi:hypothetical protein
LTARLTEWFKPTPVEEKAWAKALGVRLRKLTLSVRVALVISLIWRQIGGGGSEAARLFRLEGLLWVPLLVISQQAISLRLRTFPAVVFLRWLGSRLARAFKPS